MSNSGKVMEEVTKAYELLSKFHRELSFLMKEIEKQLLETEPPFQMLKPSGYGFTTSMSRGIDYYDDWLPTYMALFWIERTGSDEQAKEAVNIKKMIMLTFVLSDKKPFKVPELWLTVMRNLGISGYTLEQCASPISYSFSFQKTWKRYYKWYVSPSKFEKSDISFDFETMRVPLGDIESADAVTEKIVCPLVEKYLRESSCSQVLHAKK